MINSQTSQETGITRAIRIAGGQAALAKLLSAGRCGGQAHVRQQSVSLWKRKGFVPWLRAIEISTCLGGRVAPGDLIDPALRKVFNTCPSLARPTENSHLDMGASRISLESRQSGAARAPAQDGRGQAVEAHDGQ